MTEDLTPLPRIRLDSPRQVMEAFLAGAKLQHKDYHDDTGELYLYLDADSGHFCEEDGAGAKTHRLPLSFRQGDPEWEIIGMDPRRALPSGGDTERLNALELYLASMPHGAMVTFAVSRPSGGQILFRCAGDAGPTLRAVWDAALSAPTREPPHETR